jgi:hypothetical protein
MILKDFQRRLTWLLPKQTVEWYGGPRRVEIISKKHSARRTYAYPNGSWEVWAPFFELRDPETQAPYSFEWYTYKSLPLWELENIKMLLPKHIGASLGKDGFFVCTPDPELGSDYHYEILPQHYDVRIWLTRRITPPVFDLLTGWMKEAERVWISAAGGDPIWVGEVTIKGRVLCFHANLEKRDQRTMNWFVCSLVDFALANSSKFKVEIFDWGHFNHGVIPED